MSNPTTVPNETAVVRVIKCTKDDCPTFTETVTATRMTMEAIELNGLEDYIIEEGDDEWEEEFDDLGLFEEVAV